MVIKINYTSSDVYVSTSVSPVYVVVNYSGTSGGGGNFVPYSGATGDVDLGEFEIKAGQVEFDQTPTGAAGVGVMRWNDSDGTVDLGLKGGNVTLQVGQEQILRVVNKTGADLLESQYRAVRIRLAAEGGSQGQRLAVVLAQGNNDANSTDTIGIVTENITDNQEGFICTSGIIRGINTTGSLQGETWADGDIIYLSPTIPGAITKVKPTAPNHSVVLGYVIYAHNVNGKIFVKCDNGYELGELHDVNTNGVTNGQVLAYDGVDGVWKPSTNASGNIYTTDGTLTGNRTVTMGANTLSFEKDIFINGIRIGQGNVSSNRNTFLGISSGGVITTGQINVGIGFNSGIALTTGVNNTLVGGYTGRLMTTGYANTIIGGVAGYSITTGFLNTLIGRQSGLSLTTGQGNTFIGAYDTGSNGIDSGNYNVILGNPSGLTSTLSNNIILADGQGNIRIRAFDTGNVTVNSAVDAGFKFDITGTARITGDLTAASLIKSGGTSSQYLMADGSTSILTNPVTGTGVTGQVAYWNGTGSQTGSNNLFWDAANSRLGIGTNAPYSQFELYSAIDNSATTIAANRTGLKISNNINATNAYTLLKFASRNGGGGGIEDGNYISSIVLGNDNTALAFGAYIDNLTSSEWARFRGGNFLLGTTTDSGQRLQVQGDAFIRGSGATSGTIGLMVQNSGGSLLMRVLNDGQLRFGNGPFIFPISDVGSSVNTAGTNLGFYSSTTFQSTINGRYHYAGDPLIQTSGAVYNIFLATRFYPTSGTATLADLYINPTINQTGGANGITRGLYVNPTLTAAADWRSIEWSNNSGWGLYGAGTCNNFLGGSLGIGTTSPATPLHVRSTSTFTSARIETTASAGSLGVSLELKNGTNTTTIGANATRTYIYSGQGVTENLTVFHSTGNVGINTGASDAGFKLDVNGTARVSTSVTIGSESLILSSGNARATINAFSSSLINFQIASNTRMTFTAAGLAINLAGEAAPNASSILDLTSTTKGFLPPRMTNAQRTAISSPAVGLVVYCTDTVEGLYVNKSTGWTFIM